MVNNDEIELLFYDEAFFRRESTVPRGCYPKGLKAKVKCPATFDKIGVCGAVSNDDGCLYSLVFDGFDSDTFIYYLDMYVYEAIYVIRLYLFLRA